MRKTFLKIACVFVGALFTLFGIVQLLQGNMGWEEVASYASRTERNYSLYSEFIEPLLLYAGITEMPMGLLSIFLGPFLLYAGISGLGMSDSD